MISYIFFPTVVYGAGDSDEEAVRTIETMNELRNYYGITELSYSDDLNETALTHNRYMKFNRTYSSIEELGKLYYRGRYPWNRASYNDYNKSYVFELLQREISNYDEGINLLMQNPYSRYSILDPLYEDIGMNSYGDFTTYLFGGNKREKSYELVYPYSGQENVGTVFTNSYLLNPYSFDTDEKKVGIPITYSIYSSEGKVNAYRNLDVSLVNTETGKEVSISVITSVEDNNLTNTIMILPMEAYDPDTVYNVKINCEVVFNNAVSFDKKNSWYRKSVDYSGKFRTIKKDQSDNTYSYVTRSMFVEDLIKTELFVIQDSLEIIFSDVNINSPVYKYIYTAYINDIVKGYGDGLYRPLANINREMAYTILIRSYEAKFGTIQLESIDKKLKFTDSAAISSWAKEAVYKAKKIGLLTDTQELFNPNEYIAVSEFKNIMRQFKRIIN